MQAWRLALAEDSWAGSLDIVLEDIIRLAILGIDESFALLVAVG